MEARIESNQTCDEMQMQIAQSTKVFFFFSCDPTRSYGSEHVLWLILRSGQHIHRTNTKSRKLRT